MVTFKTSKKEGFREVQALLRRNWKAHQGIRRARGQLRTAIYWGCLTKISCFSNRKISFVGKGREVIALILPRSFTWCPIVKLLLLEKKMVWIHRMTSWVKNWLNCCAERTIVSSSKPSISQLLYVSLSYSSELILRSILFNILISGLHDEGKYTFSMSLNGGQLLHWRTDWHWKGFQLTREMGGQK